MFEQVSQVLRANRFEVSCFQTASAAAEYPDSAIDGKTVAIGGSHTAQEMGLYERLKTHNFVYFNAAEQRTPAQRDALMMASLATDIYITSVNGLSESTGELVNIDGGGNRLASGLFGHEKVYFIIGTNKVAPDLEGAIWRARNIAGPKNARRLGKKTTCAVRADRCYDCKHPDPICAAMVLY